MIADCENGKINLILTKEVSRFARNTVNTLNYTRRLSEIAKELDERGIPTLKNRVWSGQHVLKILNNEKYAGDLTQWKVYKPNVLAEKTFINHGDNPNAPLITVKNHHEPIVSREVFDAVQEERKRHGRLTREGMKHSNSFWLSGKMVCGKCGYSFIMNGSSQNPNIFLRCRNCVLYGKEKHTALNGELIGCDAHTFDERIVAAAMKNILRQISTLRPILEKQMLEEIQNIQLNQKSG